ncbi:hypothetical protein AZE42_09620 [Rhizopogon vesiculosus]|uniref:Uncharacterized protein n=1 Tax=Rhizopogon vesiculosus TaxID=180088 RepID=A0A1J8R1B8_9AGAM|nr:hypothetical protein AZE42_09620 [Rhizopogon vesiculosus]
MFHYVTLPYLPSFIEIDTQCKSLAEHTSTTRGSASPFWSYVLYIDSKSLGRPSYPGN